ncbi:MAG: hypothetical protein VX777_09720 [Chlamydiota bacterium]|nr:hypothetical protein [Chlamydiota bacterium]
MKKGVLSILLGALFITANTTNAYIPKPNPQEQNNFSLLFIQSAEEVTLKQDRKNPDRWTVTLYNVDPDVAYFSDKPRKMAGKVTISDFIEEWNVDNNATLSTPAGSLVTKFSHKNATGSDSERKVILSNPRYNTKKGTLTYDASNPPGKNNLEEGKHPDPVLFIEKY